jgi:hypothetical protein
VAKGVFAVRDYSKSYQNVKTTYLIAALYVFVPQFGGTMLKREWFWYGYSGMNQGHFVKSASARMLKKEHFYKSGFRWTYSRESIAEAVKGTPFQYSTWEHYEHDDMTAFFDLYSRYPCVEYLTKLDMDNLIREKLRGEPTYGALNWNGKNILQVLRMSKQDFKTIKQHPTVGIDFNFLRIHQVLKKIEPGLSVGEIDYFATVFGAYHVNDFKMLSEYMSINQILNYLKKQREHAGKRTLTGELRQLLTDYRDYINDCKQLQMDLNDYKTLFPKDLIAAHQRTTEKIKLKSSKEMNKKFKDRARQLQQKYYFEFENLVIKPPQNFKEMLKEGNTLHHCVATNYGKRHAEGDTTIMFIRNRTAPEKPFYTVEIYKGEVKQVQGDNHCAPTPEVKRFMEAFESAKLGKKIKVRIPA